MRAGVLFDLDETLVDRRASLDRYAHTLWESAGSELPRDAFVACFHALDGKGRVPRTEFFARFCAAALPAWQTQDFEAHFYANAWREPLLLNDAYAVLAELRSRGFALGIVSNGRALPQNTKLRNAGLTTRVDAWLVSETAGVKKPDPAIFQRMIATLAIAPERSWFVGDDPRADVCGAASVGLRALWLARELDWPEALAPCYHARIASLKECLDLIGTP